MEASELKAKIYEWAKEVGPDKARVEMVNKGIGFSTIEKLIGGRYEPAPRTSLEWALEQILKEHEKQAS